MLEAVVVDVVVVVVEVGWVADLVERGVSDELVAVEFVGEVVVAAAAAVVVLANCCTTSYKLETRSDLFESGVDEVGID